MINHYKEIVENNNVKHYKYATRSLKIELVNVALKTNYKVYSHIPAKYKYDKEVCEYVIKKNPGYFTRQLKSRKIIKKIMNDLPEAYFLLPEKFRQDTEFILLYLKMSNDIDKLFDFWGGKIVNDDVLSLCLVEHPISYEIMKKDMNREFMIDRLTRVGAVMTFYNAPSVEVYRNYFTSLVDPYCSDHIQELMMKYPQVLYDMICSLEYEEMYLEENQLTVDYDDGTTIWFKLPKKYHVKTLDKLKTLVSSHVKSYIGHRKSFLGMGGYDCRIIL